MAVRQKRVQPIGKREKSTHSHRRKLSTSGSWARAAALEPSPLVVRSRRSRRRRRGLVGSAGSHRSHGRSETFWENLWRFWALLCKSAFFLGIRVFFEARVKQIEVSSSSVLGCLVWVTYAFLVWVCQKTLFHDLFWTKTIEKGLETFEAVCLR